MTVVAVESQPIVGRCSNTNNFRRKHHQVLNWHPKEQTTGSALTHAALLRILAEWVLCRRRALELRRGCETPDNPRRRVGTCACVRKRELEVRKLVREQRDQLALGRAIRC